VVGDFGRVAAGHALYRCASRWRPWASGLASELLALIGRAGEDPAHAAPETELVIREPA
jgi:hypothetical protein